MVITAELKGTVDVLLQRYVCITMHPGHDVVAGCTYI